MIDDAYYDRRERQERARAAASTDPVAQRLHLEMAGRYAALRRNDAAAAAAPLRLVVPHVHG